MKIFATLLFSILCFGNLSFANSQNCQIYNLVLANIENEYLNGVVDSYSRNTKIDPIDPNLGKAYKVKRNVHLDFYVYPELTKLSNFENGDQLLNQFKRKGSIGKVVRVDNLNLKDCISDSAIQSRFEATSKIARFTEQYYRTGEINGKKILFNPMRLIFSNILLMDNGKAFVSVDVLYGNNPGRIKYYYIFKKTRDNWVIEDCVFQAV